MDNVIYRAMVHEDIERILAKYPGYVGSGPRKHVESIFNEQERGLRTVVIAECGDEIVGYITLLPSAKNGPFKNQDIPAIRDLIVYEEFQEQGIGTELMNRMEALAAETSDMVCLGVGLHGISGAAQRLFVKRGYVPDGSGVWYGRSPARAGVTIEEVGGLTLYMSKKLR